MTPKLLGLILFSVGLSAIAQITLKFGMSGGSIAEVLQRNASLVEAFLTILSDVRVLAGLALYGLGALIWLLVLARVDVSAAYPFVGLGFVLTALLGHILLGEPLSAQRLLGTMLVICGVFLVGRTA
jgi:multidrug transporter EmrE-like cation transporter